MKEQELKQRIEKLETILAQILKAGCVAPWQPFYEDAQAVMKEGQCKQ